MAEISMNKVGTEMVEWLRPGECPDCGGRIFEFGPRGGAAHNIRCVQCGQWWNVVFFAPEGLIQRINPQ